MTTQEYLQAVAQLPYGKTLPTAKYLLDLGDPRMPFLLRTATEELRKRLSIGPEFNLLKFSLRDPKISFLSYPTFERDGHPALAEAIIVDLISGKSRRDNYSGRRNPPILHRKETFVPAEHPRFSEFRKLTEAEEKIGLLVDTARIGFRLNWEKALAEKKCLVRGHRLVPVDSQANGGNAVPARMSPPPKKIARDRTALMRKEVSKPVKLILEHKQMRPGYRFFDYGCGYSFDVNAISALGFVSSGWDPAHAPDGAKTEAEVVNLGFVLNVIEDPAERVETLLEAWRLTKRVLVVSTLISGNEVYADVQLFGDGVLTSRDTFQKYFEQAELHALLEDTLGHEAVPVSLGTFFVFRETSDLHDFLASRTRRFIDWESLSRRLGITRALNRRRDPYDEHRELLDSYWETLLELGRTPRPEEFERLPEVRLACGSIPRAFELFSERFGAQTFDAARARRREDMLVYVAANQLRKRIPFTQLSSQLQHDIKSHFGTYAQAEDKARELLFASGDQDELELALGKIKEGHLDPIEGHFTIHRDLLDELPSIFRVYVACAARLFGDPKQADLIKIHLHSKKLTFLHYVDFLGDPFPELARRIKIELGRLFVTVFDSPPGSERQLLLFKERFLAKSHPGRDEMERLSARLRARGLTEDNVGHGPTRSNFEAWLKSEGLDRALRRKPAQPVSPSPVPPKTNQSPP